MRQYRDCQSSHLPPTPTISLPLPLTIHRKFPLIMYYISAQVKWYPWKSNINLSSVLWVFIWVLNIYVFPTENGKVLKAVINATASGQRRRSGKDFEVGESVITQSWDVFPGSKIKTLRLSRNRRLFIGTETQLRIIPVDNCQEFTSCQKCVGIRDPHCSWNSNTQECVNAESQGRRPELLQDITRGSIEQCPAGM